ncbi:hypothetical protein, partial [Undibacterium luofuense]
AGEVDFMRADVGGRPVDWGIGSPGDQVTRVNTLSYSLVMLSELSTLCCTPGMALTLRHIKL